MKKRTKEQEGLEKKKVKKRRDIAGDENYERFPVCPFHDDCFALVDDSRCNCLISTNFNGRDCPFYKVKNDDKTA